VSGLQKRETLQEVTNLTDKPSGNERLPRNDRRRGRTRNALIGAGQRLFADRSMDGVTIDDITSAADVAKGSFYNHFDGKESLGDAIVELVQGDCEHEVYAANIDVADPVARVARAMGALVRYARVHPERYRAMINLTHRRAEITAPINRGLRHDIEAGLVGGSFHGISVESGMLAVFAMISSAIDHLRARDAEVQEIIRQMGFMLLRSLGVTDEVALEAASAAAAEFGEPAQSRSPSAS